MYGGLIEEDIETNEIWVFDVLSREFFEFENKANLKCIYFIKFKCLAYLDMVLY